MTPLIDIYFEWVNNLQFRKDFRSDPERALKQVGFMVSPQDLVKIKAMLRLDKSTNEKLDDRISK